MIECAHRKDTNVATRVQIFRQQIIILINPDIAYGSMGCQRFPQESPFVRKTGADFLQSDLLKPLQNLRHSGPADAKMAGKRRPVLELAGVEQGLVMMGQFNPVGTFLGCGRWFRFLRESGSPRVNSNYRRST